MIEENQESIHAALQKCLEAGISNGIPGISAHISSSKETLFSSVVGATSLIKQTPPPSLGPEHVFGVGSISKIFTSLVTLQLIDERKLSLDDPVEKYLDSSVLQGIPNAPKATIAQLLNHTSGIPSWEDDPKWIVEGRGKRLNPAKIWGKTETLDYIRYENNHQGRELEKHIKRIRTDYIAGLRSELMAERQRAVVIYLIEKLSFLVYNEYNINKVGESFDWCALRSENIRLHEPQTIELDVGNLNVKTEVVAQVFRNFKIFTRTANQPGDTIFDRINVTSQLTSYLQTNVTNFGQAKELNQYLATYIPGLTPYLFGIYQNQYLTQPPSIPKPGKFSYSNTNFTFLGLITETITSSTAASQIRKRILEPLDLRRTWLEGFEPNPHPHLNIVPSRYHWATPSFQSTAGICPLFTHPESHPDLIDVSISNTSVEWTAGGFLSHPSDLTALGLAIRDKDPRIMSPASWEIMHDFISKGPKSPIEIGHGIFRIRRGDRKWLGHDGSLLGFAGSLFWAEEGDVVGCVLGNVGTMHAGNVSSAASIALQGEFLGLVTKLGKLHEG